MPSFAAMYGYKYMDIYEMSGTLPHLDGLQHDLWGLGRMHVW